MHPAFGQSWSRWRQLLQIIHQWSSWRESFIIATAQENWLINVAESLNNWSLVELQQTVGDSWDAANYWCIGWSVTLNRISESPKLIEWNSSLSGCNILFFWALRLQLVQPAAESTTCSSTIRKSRKTNSKRSQLVGPSQTIIASRQRTTTTKK